jgi:putative transposase
VCESAYRKGMGYRPTLMSDTASAERFRGTVSRGRLPTQGITGQTILVSEAVGSVGRAALGTTGDSYDNALAETINGLYKAEVIWRRGPRRGMESIEYSTLEWVDWFNSRRLLEPIGDIPPVEFEQAYYRQQESVALAA